MKRLGKWLLSLTKVQEPKKFKEIEKMSEEELQKELKISCGVLIGLILLLLIVLISL